MHHAKNHSVTDGCLAIVRLSEAFLDIWQELGDGLSTQVRWVSPETGVPSSGDIAAVILAAGGREQDAVTWLDQHAPTGGPPVFVVGSDVGRRTALGIAARGALDYFALPEDLEILRNGVGAAVERYAESARSKARHLNTGPGSAFQLILGESTVLQNELQRAERLLPHRDASALITGETGTGKELLARAIHEGGPRSTAPFVPVNCAALPANLVESELFGHEKGAFTNAHSAKPGLFEVADGGTLFLDEVGAMPPEVQAKLLRVLEDKEVRRVGGTKSRKVDIRVLAATNADLVSESESGVFRSDLYFRLAVITLTLPPLRDRGDDVVLLAEAFLGGLATHHRIPVPALGTRAASALRGYHWPGNIRELRNSIERALLLSEPGELNLEELVLGPIADTHEGPSPIPFPASLSSITAAAAQATIDLCEGNRSEAARRLEISRQRLRRLVDDDSDKPNQEKVLKSGGTS